MLAQANQQDVSIITPGVQKELERFRQTLSKARYVAGTEVARRYLSQTLLPQPVDCDPELAAYRQLSEEERAELRAQAEHEIETIRRKHAEAHARGGCCHFKVITEEEARRRKIRQTQIPVPDDCDPNDPLCGL